MDRRPPISQGDRGNASKAYTETWSGGGRGRAATRSSTRGPSVSSPPGSSRSDSQPVASTRTRSASSRTRESVYPSPIDPSLRNAPPAYPPSTQTPRVKRFQDGSSPSKAPRSAPSQVYSTPQYTPTGAFQSDPSASFPSQDSHLQIGRPQDVSSRNENGETANLRCVFPGCGQKFSASSAVKKHEWAAHEIAYNCTECAYEGKNEGLHSKECRGKPFERPVNRNGYGCGLCGSYLPTFEIRWKHILEHGKKGVQRTRWNYILEFTGLSGGPAWHGQNRLLVRNFNPDRFEPGELKWAKEQLERQDVFTAPIETDIFRHIFAPVDLGVWPMPTGPEPHSSALNETGLNEGEFDGHPQLAPAPAAHSSSIPFQNPRSPSTRYALEQDIARLEKILRSADPTPHATTPALPTAFRSYASSDPSLAQGIDPALLDFSGSSTHDAENYDHTPAFEASSWESNSMEDEANDDDYEDEDDKMKD